MHIYVKVKAFFYMTMEHVIPQSEKTEESYGSQIW